MHEAVIVSAVRSGVAKGKADGSLANIHPVDLAAEVIKAAVAAAGIERLPKITGVRDGRLVAGDAVIDAPLRQSRRAVEHDTPWFRAWATHRVPSLTDTDPSMEFARVRMDSARFDHGETGYPLEGEHRGVACLQVAGELGPLAEGLRAVKGVAKVEEQTDRLADIAVLFVGGWKRRRNAAAYRSLLFSLGGPFDDALRVLEPREHRGGYRLAL